MSYDRNHFFRESCDDLETLSSPINIDSLFKSNTFFSNDGNEEEFS